ncbi:MAG: hypothetical protein GTO61_10015 [Gemmatimonadales bacterium]|nr:hypothetical protein [Gemmatimonadales bacterium]NIO31547.1 hypothetical protein [Gemmatimonadota bacterium]
MTESTRSLLALCIMMFVLVGQIIGLYRYVQRLPDDRLGLALYGIAIVAITIMVFSLFARWREAVRNC